MTTIACSSRTALTHNVLKQLDAFYRHQSTTSAIKAGLRAEPPTRFRDGGRSRTRTSRFDRAADNTSRPVRRFKGATNATDAFEEGLQRNPPSDGDDEFRARSAVELSTGNGLSADQSDFVTDGNRAGSIRNAMSSAQDQDVATTRFGRLAVSRRTVSEHTEEHDDPSRSFITQSLKLNSDNGSAIEEEKQTTSDQDPSARSAFKSLRSRSKDHHAESRHIAASEAHFETRSKVESARSTPEDTPTARLSKAASYTTQKTSKPSQLTSEDVPTEPQGESTQRTRRSRLREFGAPRPEIHGSDGIPVPIPYTTASSEFIYGSNSVFAALQAKVRQFYRLYIHKNAEAPNIGPIRFEASKQGINITRTTDTALLNLLSGNRPHNGVVLEASPVPARPVNHFKKISNKPEIKHFELELARQSSEDRLINGTATEIPFPRAQRQAFVLFLDGITDPGNLGNIVRSAYFFGVDAVVICTNTCAPITSPVFAKATAGACEGVQLLRTQLGAEFLETSRRNGWTICAAVAPGDHENSFGTEKRRSFTTQNLPMSSLLEREHCILMLGAEGEGLRKIYKQRARVYVTIPHGNRSPDTKIDLGVDSLNVATAGAVLMGAFMASVRKRKIVHRDMSEVEAAPKTDRLWD